MDKRPPDSIKEDAKSKRGSDKRKAKIEDKPIVEVDLVEARKREAAGGFLQRRRRFSLQMPRRTTESMEAHHQETSPQSVPQEAKSEGVEGKRHKRKKERRREVSGEAASRLRASGSSSAHPTASYSSNPSSQGLGKSYRQRVLYGMSDRPHYRAEQEEAYFHRLCGSSDATIELPSTRDGSSALSSSSGGYGIASAFTPRHRLNKERSSISASVVVSSSPAPSARLSSGGTREQEQRTHSARRTSATLSPASSTSSVVSNAAAMSPSSSASSVSTATAASSPHSSLSLPNAHHHHHHPQSDFLGAPPHQSHHHHHHHRSSAQGGAASVFVPVPLDQLQVGGSTPTLLPSLMASSHTSPTQGHLTSTIPHLALDRSSLNEPSNASVNAQQTLPAAPATAHALHHRSTTASTPLSSARFTHHRSLSAPFFHSWSYGNIDLSHQINLNHHQSVKHVLTANYQAKAQAEQAKIPRTSTGTPSPNATHLQLLSKTTKEQSAALSKALQAHKFRKEIVLERQEQGRSAMAGSALALLLALFDDQLVSLPDHLETVMYTHSAWISSSQLLAFLIHLYTHGLDRVETALMRETSTAGEYPPSISSSSTLEASDSTNDSISTPSHVLPSSVQASQNLQMALRSRVMEILHTWIETCPTDFKSITRPSTPSGLDNVHGEMQKFLFSIMERGTGVECNMAEIVLGTMNLALRSTANPTPRGPTPSSNASGATLISSSSGVTSSSQRLPSIPPTLGPGGQGRMSSQLFPRFKLKQRQPELMTMLDFNPRLLAMQLTIREFRNAKRVTAAHLATAKPASMKEASDQPSEEESQTTQASQQGSSSQVNLNMASGQSQTAVTAQGSTATEKRSSSKRPRTKSRRDSSSSSQKDSITSSVPSSTSSLSSLSSSKSSANQGPTTPSPSGGLASSIASSPNLMRKSRSGQAMSESGSSGPNTETKIAGASAPNLQESSSDSITPNRKTSVLSLEDDRDGRQSGAQANLSAHMVKVSVGTRTASGLPEKPSFPSTPTESASMAQTATTRTGDVSSSTPSDRAVSAMAYAENEESLSSTVTTSLSANVPTTPTVPVSAEPTSSSVSPRMAMSVGIIPSPGKAPALPMRSSSSLGGASSQNSTSPRSSEDTSVREAVVRSQRLSGWVTTEIVTCPNLSARATILTNFVDVAHRCYVLRNYQSAYAIYLGITRSPVTRLSDTWRALSAEHTYLWNKLVSRLSNSVDFFDECLAAPFPKVMPLIPALQLLSQQQSLVTYHRRATSKGGDQGSNGNQASLAGSTTAPSQMLNFGKFRGISQIVKPMMLSQNVPYPFAEHSCPEVQAFLENHLHSLPFSQLMRFSQEVEQGPVVSMRFDEQQGHRVVSKASAFDSSEEEDDDNDDQDVEVEEHVRRPSRQRKTSRSSKLTKKKSSHSSATNDVANDGDDNKREDDNDNFEYQFDYDDFDEDEDFEDEEAQNDAAKYHKIGLRPRHTSPKRSHGITLDLPRVDRQSGSSQGTQPHPGSTTTSPSSTSSSLKSPTSLTMSTPTSLTPTANSVGSPMLSLRNSEGRVKSRHRSIVSTHNTPTSVPTHTTGLSVQVNSSGMSLPGPGLTGTSSGPLSPSSAPVHSHNLISPLASPHSASSYSSAPLASPPTAAVIASVPISVSSGSNSVSTSSPVAPSKSDPDLSRDKALRDLHNEVKGKWQRPLAQCSVGADLPRFVRKIAVINDATGEVDFNGGGDEGAASGDGVSTDAPAQSNDANTADLICQLLKVFASALDAKKETKAMEKSLDLYFGPRSKPGSSTGSFDVAKETDRFCREILGESSRVTSLLKVASSQGIVAPAWMKLRLFILSRFGFKDVKRGWHIAVLHSDTKVTVVHRKREASNEETTGHAEFEFTWEMRMSFSRKMEKLEQASFVITNVQVSPNINEKKLAGFKSAIQEWFMPGTELFPRELFRSCFSPIIPNAITIGTSPREISQKKDKKKKSFGSVAKEWLGRSPHKSEAPAPVIEPNTSSSTKSNVSISDPSTTTTPVGPKSGKIKSKGKGVDFDLVAPLQQSIGHSSVLKSKPPLKRRLSDSSSETVARHRRQKSFEVGSDSEDHQGASHDSSGSIKETVLLSASKTGEIPHYGHILHDSSPDFLVFASRSSHSKSGEIPSSQQAAIAVDSSHLEKKKKHRASAGPSHTRRSRAKSNENPPKQLSRQSSSRSSTNIFATREKSPTRTQASGDLGRSPSSSPPPISVLHGSATAGSEFRHTTFDREEDSVGPRSRSSTQSSISWSSDLSSTSFDSQGTPSRKSGEFGRERSPSMGIVVTTRKRTTSVDQGAADAMLSLRHSIKSQSSVVIPTAVTTTTTSSSYTLPTLGTTSPVAGSVSPLQGPSSPVYSPPAFGSLLQSSSTPLARRSKELKDSSKEKEQSPVSLPKDSIAASRRKSVGSKESGHFSLSSLKGEKKDKEKEKDKDKEKKKKTDADDE